MARPITWQDVAAPRGQALAIESFGRAADRVTEAISGFGDITERMNTEAVDANTKNAVAAIANAADPKATAAGIPRSWQFDPLAIATAANAREGQLFDRKVSESNLRENEAQITNLQSEMADRESKRHIATLIAPYEALARAGKDFDVDESSDPMWKTPAGFEAKKHLEDLKNTAFNQAQERERTALQRTQARAAQLQLDQALNRQRAADAFVAWKQTPAGMAAGAAEDQAKGREFGVQFNVGEAFGATLPGTYGNTRGIASETQLASTSPEGIGYDSAISALTADTRRLEREKAVATRDLQLASAGAKAMEKNNYAGMAAEALNQAVLSNNKAMASGEGWFTLAKDSQDVQEARDDARATAKGIVGDVARDMKLPVPDEKYVPLMPEQEANVAELLLVGNDDAAEELVRQYVAFNLVGGQPGLATLEQARVAPYDTQIARNQRAAQKTEAAAAGKTSVPVDAREAYERTNAGKGWKQVTPKPWDFVDITLQKNLNQR